jgi:hypothetical protein
MRNWMGYGDSHLPLGAQGAGLFAPSLAWHYTSEGATFSSKVSFSSKHLEDSSFSFIFAAKPRRI